MGPWLERLGRKSSGKVPLRQLLLLSLVLISSWDSTFSGVSSGRSKKLTSEGVEGPSVSSDSDSSGVSDVSELPLRLRSCIVRLLRGSVPTGSSGWASAASDTLRRTGSVRGAGSGAGWGRSAWLCWLGVWVAGREGHGKDRGLWRRSCILGLWRPGVFHQTPSLGMGGELQVPRLQLQGVT